MTRDTTQHRAGGDGDGAGLDPQGGSKAEMGHGADMAKGPRVVRSFGKPVDDDRWPSLKAALSRKWKDLNDEDLSAVKANMDELAHRLRDRYELSLGEAREAADEFINDVDETAMSMYRRARGMAEDAAEAFDETVRRYTWATVATAFILGGVIGYVCARDEPRSRWSRWS